MKSAIFGLCASNVETAGRRSMRFSLPGTVGLFFLITNFIFHMAVRRSSVQARPSSEAGMVLFLCRNLSFLNDTRFCVFLRGIVFWEPRYIAQETNKDRRCMITCISAWNILVCCPNGTLKFPPSDLTLQVTHKCDQSGFSTSTDSSYLWETLWRYQIGLLCEALFHL